MKFKNHTVTLSTAMTPVLKFGIPLAIMMFTVALESKRENADWFISILFTLIFFFFFSFLKKVSIKRGSLIVSNYIKTIQIPLSEIESITYWWWWNPSRIHIHLKHKSPFGKTIDFKPKILQGCKTASFLENLIMYRVDSI